MKKIKILLTMLMIGFTGLYMSCNQPTNTPVPEVPAETTEETAEEAEKRRQVFLEWVEGEWINEDDFNAGLPEHEYLLKIENSKIVADGFVASIIDSDLKKIKTYSESKDVAEWNWEGTSKVLVDKKTAFLIFEWGGVLILLIKSMKVNW